jgi:hypothetical protein
MRKGWLFGGLAALALASALWANNGVVHLKDGRVFSGDVDESNPPQVTVTLDGVKEIFQRDDINSIEYPGSVDEQYADRMDKLGEHDITGRLAVANWARELGRYDLARRAAIEAMDIDPADSRASQLLHDIGVEAALHRGGPAPAVSSPVTAPAAAQIAPKPYLTVDQINSIRQLELRPDETFRVSFTHDVRQRFLDLGTTDTGSFKALSPVEQARMILDSGTTAMAVDVRIDSDPAALAEYHHRIQPRVIGGCTLGGCHNTVVAAGGFALFSGDESPEAWYTNYYLLQTYVRPATADGAPGKFMIDRTHPDQSLLLEYGLPRAQAKSPHPPALNFHPAFSGRDDLHYELVEQWITGMLRPDGGEYPEIHYRPPWATASAAATTQLVTAGTQPAAVP